MKKTLSCLMFIISLYLKSQVGISTSTPKTSLHVNGDLQVTNEFQVGGSKNTSGDSGRSGSVLVSQGVGNSPVWKTLDEVNIPVETNLSIKTTTSASSSANTSTPVIFDSVARSDNSYLTYSTSTGKFTVVKAGYYLFTAYLKYSISSSAANGTAVTAVKKNGVKIVASTTSHLTGTTTINHNLTKTHLFAVGDVISLEGLYSSQYSLLNSSISFMYLGN
ncbi:C1q-like domain-containing protein [Chryseobacterium oryctis]|uniref:C1q domain-containing protein n=1 Tax=Chryseobacterium oryctis TaxID=2952618 RepID=A0ABT3HMW1_9FLAO|nr:hypothetical protein [Chryseobacterium oryctis]MCW3161126.1 hypothetical protein [Chryseobacterium oryctis]